MDDSILNEDFAFELVKYVLKKFDMEYDGQLIFSQGRSNFDQVIGKAVVGIMRMNIDKIDTTYKEMRSKYTNPEREVALYAFDIIPDYFPNGYLPDKFLYFCALLIGLSSTFYINQNKEVVYKITDVIATILRGFMYIGEFKKSGGFTELISASETVIDILCKRSKELRELL